MQSVTLKAQVGNDGKLTIDLPEFIGAEVEIIYTVQKTKDEPRDAMGWPIGYFEETYGILSDDPIARGDQGEFEVRESLE